MWLAPVLSGVILLSLATAYTARYGGNLSSLLHLSREFAAVHPPPPGVVVYDAPGYDGMLYYQIARDLPILFSDDAQRLRQAPPAAYSYQRILLPLLARIVALGRDELLPTTLTLLNLGSALISLFLLRRSTSPTTLLHSLTIALNPAVVVGILFSLSEPLAIFLTTAFLIRYRRMAERIDIWQMILLSLAMLSRETTLPFVLFLMLLESLRRRWHNTLLLCLPLLTFLMWEAYVGTVFGVLPFLGSTGQTSSPFVGVVTLLRESATGPTRFHLSSLAFLAFLIPTLVSAATVLLKHAQQSRPWSSLPTLPVLLFGFAPLYAILAPHIWGTITSVGRVVPALYPLYALYATTNDTNLTRLLSLFLIGISIVTAFGLITTPHPYTIS